MFHTGSINSSNQSASSKRFLRRSQTDPYGKLKSSNRGEKVYLARSAHKLIQLDSNFKLFSKFKHQKINVLELGSSPGGWTEVHHHHHLICCDLKPISNSILVNLPLNLKFDFLQGDFLTSELQTKTLELFQKSTTLSNSNLKNSSIATIILSDLLAPISGIPIKDSQNSFDLCLSVLNLTQSLLKDQIPNQDDSLIIKHLQSDLTHELLNQLKLNWNSIKWFKPLASRSESREGYFIARQRKS
ncbi:ribosomal RNA methyltransferase FtsJ domain-containing protein [Melampsora americana]|nr:ribosomal RNA methyltransferase FtsJ domain-containing protein [Melampsora americana]